MRFAGRSPYPSGPLQGIYLTPNARNSLSPIWRAANTKIREIRESYPDSSHPGQEGEDMRPLVTTGLPLAIVLAGCNVSGTDWTDQNRDLDARQMVTVQIEIKRDWF